MCSAVPPCLPPAVQLRRDTQSQNASADKKSPRSPVSGFRDGRSSAVPPCLSPLPYSARSLFGALTSPYPITGKPWLLTRLTLGSPAREADCAGLSVPARTRRRLSGTLQTWHNSVKAFCHVVSLTYYTAPALVKTRTNKYFFTFYGVLSLSASPHTGSTRCGHICYRPASVPIRAAICTPASKAFWQSRGNCSWCQRRLAGSSQ